MTQKHDRSANVSGFWEPYQNNKTMNSDTVICGTGHCPFMLSVVIRDTFIKHKMIVLLMCSYYNCFVFLQLLLVFNTWLRILKMTFVPSEYARVHVQEPTVSDYWWGRPHLRGGLRGGTEADHQTAAEYVSLVAEFLFLFDWIAFVDLSDCTSIKLEIQVIQQRQRYAGF